MNNDFLHQLYWNLNQKSTEELIEIWRENNQVEYTELSFKVIHGILQDRHIEIPPQDDPAEEKKQNANPEYYGSDKMSVIQILFSLKGRVGLETFWLVIAFMIIFMVILSILDNAFFKYSDRPGLLYLIGSIIVFWPSFAIMVKRWHDRDKPGIWCVIGLLPIFGQIWAFIELGFLSGTNGPNFYGAKSF